MLGFTGDGEDQVEHLVTAEIQCLLLRFFCGCFTVFSKHCSRFTYVSLHRAVKAVTLGHPQIIIQIERCSPFHAQRSPQKQSSPPPQVGRVCHKAPGQSGRSWTCGDLRAAASRNELWTELLHWRHNRKTQLICKISCWLRLSLKEN